MPNYCDYEMRIKGPKSAVERVLKCLQADYNYTEGKPEHKHFFRVFQAEEGKWTRNSDGTFTLEVYGYCAWSVHCAMLGTDKEFHSYYADVKARHPDIFMGTNLWEQSKDCEIEIFSEETEGMMFSEHYYFKNGKALVDEVAEITYSEDEGGEICSYDSPYRTYGDVFAYSYL